MKKTCGKYYETELNFYEGAQCAIMLLEDIMKYCMSKQKAYEEYPFGDVPICYKLNNKIFAQIYPYPEDYKITLKCTADAGQFYRMVHPGKVVRGYHCPPVQQPYWNIIWMVFR